MEPAITINDLIVQLTLFSRRFCRRLTAPLVVFVRLARYHRRKSLSCLTRTIAEHELPIAIALLGSSS
jgi:hypothetical protein